MAHHNGAANSAGIRASAANITFATAAASAA
jgi:hypothetical protein